MHRLILAPAVALILAVGSLACSTPNPTSPTGTATVAVNEIPPLAADSSGVSLPTLAQVSTAVTFPPRNEPFDFRNQLEAKYRDGLHRSASSSYVDIEGDIVWIQEYIRYRVNQCSHLDAVQRVLNQIDTGVIAPVCGNPPSGSVSFPPRNEPFDFRNQLEAKYRDGLHRTAGSTYVDIEGDIVWVQEYLRYRVNYCDHATAATKVFQQIDGRGVQPVCTPPQPLAFNKTSPTNGATGLSRSPSLNWEASPGTTRFEYCVDSTLNNICDGTWTSAGTATSRTLSGLQYSTSYEWQVRATNPVTVTSAEAPALDIEYANGGAWWQFRTQAAPVPWSHSGTGADVFTMPTSVTRVRIQGAYSGYSENFVVYVGGHLLVNVVLGTSQYADGTTFSGVYVTTGGTVQVKYSTGLSWSLTEVFY